MLDITTDDDVEEIILSLGRIMRNKHDPASLKAAAKLAKRTIISAWKKIESLEKCCYNCGNPFRAHGMKYERRNGKLHWERDLSVKRDSKEISCYCHPGAWDYAYQSKNGLKTVCENWKPIRKKKKSRKYDCQAH